MSQHVITSTSEQRALIVVERGVSRQVMKHLPDRQDRTTVAILAQPSVARLAAEIAEDLRSGGLQTFIRELPDRESAKDFSVVAATMEWLNDHAFTRHDTIVGVGGGAVTDVAGFIAATYLRGVEAVYVPTTLLGAVDAAIGGKTGVNVGGKNLAGAFHHPTLVATDPALLERLPEDLIREGAAEALKTGLIADPEIVAIYEKDGLQAPLDEIVDRSVAVKANIVSDDFRESGRRALLNYGHTIGHAVETATGIPHGHAVAVGMEAAGRASSIITGFAEVDRQRAVLQRLGLPTAAPSCDRNEVLRLVGLDKKRDAAGIRMVLLNRVGSAEVSVVDDATVAAALEAVRIT